MRTAVKNVILIFLVTSSLAILSNACEKSSGEDDSECKTCKAYGTSGLEAEQTVCSPDAEESFRAQNAGKEISCF